MADDIREEMNRQIYDEGIASAFTVVDGLRDKFKKVLETDMRTFDTGATRDTTEGKLDYGGFLSPIVLKRFAEYMHKHRVQSDGTLRAADNWQKGIPVDAYMESMLRHVMDVWLHDRGYADEARESYEDALCGVLFNVQGLLLEGMK